MTAEALLEPCDADVLDAEVVEQLVRLGAAAGEDLMGQLTVLYVADAEDRVAELRSALVAHDAPTIFRAAHTLTGASASIGAVRLARLCNALAITGSAGDLADGDALIAAIGCELARVRAALESRSITR